MGRYPDPVPYGSRPHAAEPAAPTAPAVRRPSPAVIAAVAESCRYVANRPVQLTETLYVHLFEMAPGLRAKFPADMREQMQRMTDTLLTAIQQLAKDDTAEIEDTLRRLGAGHRARHDVQPEHYVYIGHALTRAVRDLTGVEWSGSLSSSWIAVTQWVTALMNAEEPAAPARQERPQPTAQDRPAPVPPQAGYPESLLSAPHGWF